MGGGIPPNERHAASAGSGATLAHSCHYVKGGAETVAKLLVISTEAVPSGEISLNSAIGISRLHFVSLEMTKEKEYCNGLVRNNTIVISSGVAT